MKGSFPFFSLLPSSRAKEGNEIIGKEVLERIEREECSSPHPLFLTGRKKEEDSHVPPPTHLPSPPSPPPPPLPPSPPSFFGTPHTGKNNRRRLRRMGGPSPFSPFLLFHLFRCPPFGRATVIGSVEVQGRRLRPMSDFFPLSFFRRS